MHEQADGRGEADDVEVLVVGGGVAGLRTVAELRRRGLTGPVLLAGLEEEAPYDRTTLSVELFTGGLAPSLAAQGLGDLEELDVTWWPATRARSLTLDDGSALVGLERRGDQEVVVRARHVVVATGAEAITPPWPQARTLRTATDARALRGAVGAGTRLVVVGAGWIGTEVAGAAAAAGARVTVVEAAPRPLSRAPEVLGAHVRPWFEAAGVELLTGQLVVSVEGPEVGNGGGAEGGGDRADGAAGEHVVTLVGGRELRADVVLAALGALPATAWLGTGLTLTDQGHVVVDAAGRAEGGDGVVWAVGDAAAVTASGVVEPGAHWEGALHHPAAVAASILGEPVPDLPAPYVFSEQLGHDVAVVGTPVGDPDVVRADGAGVTWLWAPQGRLLAGATADHPRDVAPLRRALAGGATPALDATVAADPARRLRDAIG